jgi:NADH:ubiquinone oxidoreductase subunit 3 (subunit A)
LIEAEYRSSETILGNLNYYLVSNLIIAILLLVVNTYFSLSVSYLDKGGGFECGFTSFIQTRERFNVIFYRVSLLFLVFDLEIILIFPFTAIYLKNQNNSKNNVLVFLYILVVGFVYELKEGALNIVKTIHSTEININDLLKIEPISENINKDSYSYANNYSSSSNDEVHSYQNNNRSSARPY